MRKNDSPAHSTSYYLAAGGLAHLLETAIGGHLIDRVMVQQQAYGYKSIQQSIRSVYQSHGWKGFNNGFRWGSLASTIRGAGGWTLLNRTQQFYSQYFQQASGTSLFNLMVAFTTAASEITLIACPLERFKVIEMTTFSPLKLFKMAIQGGPRFIFHGWTAMVVQRSLSWMSYMTFYHHAGKGNTPLSQSHKFLLGLTTGGFIAVFSTPLDLIKTQQQMHRNGPVPKMSDIISSAYKADGLKGCFRGLTLRMARTAWSGAFITLMLDKLDAFPEGMKL